MRVDLARRGTSRAWGAESLAILDGDVVAVVEHEPSSGRERRIIFFVLSFEETEIGVRGRKGRSVERGKERTLGPPRFDSRPRSRSTPPLGLAPHVPSRTMLRSKQHVPLPR